MKSLIVIEVNRAWAEQDGAFLNSLNGVDLDGPKLVKGANS